MKANSQIGCRIPMVNLVFFLISLLLMPMLTGPPTVSGLPKLHNAIQLTSPNPQRLGTFGGAVATDGKLVVVGAWGESAGRPYSGRAYIFGARTGNLLFTLVSPNPDLGGNFGFSVAVDRGLVVVGAPFETIAGFEPFAGRAYVFSSTTGDLLYTLSNPNPVPLDPYRLPVLGAAFGSAVAISGGLIVISGLGEGRVYVYSASTGVLMLSLANPGRSVALDGGLLVVGSGFEDVAGNPAAGRAYVFNVTTGRLLLTLSSPNPQIEGLFGWSVWVGKGLVVVGARQETIAGQFQAGNAYVFGATTGSLLFTLTSPDPHFIGSFGASVSGGDGVVLVGAPSENGGRAYVFNIQTGRLMFALSSTHPPNGGGFGWSLSASDSVVVVGAGFENAGASSEDDSVGHTYIF